MFSFNARGLINSLKRPDSSEYSDHLPIILKTKTLIMMPTSQKNIWDGLNFTNPTSKSAYEYLIEQSSELEKATNSELKMQVEGVDAYLDEKQPLTLVVLYKLYVVAPKLGNFRRKLMTITERSYGQRFPVDIYCHLDDTKEEMISEIDFLKKINEIILRPSVQATIINLYNQSKEF